MDLSEVNKDVIGVYTATINYKDESKTFRIKVTDTEEPEITLERSRFYFEVSADLALADVVKSVMIIQKLHTDSPIILRQPIAKRI